MEPTPHDSPRGVIVAFPESAIVRRPEPPSVPRPSWGWALLVALLVAVSAILGTAWWAARDVSRAVGRIDQAFPAPSVPRPTRPLTAGKSLNLLVAGLDGEGRTGWDHGTRSDALMLVHLDADRRHAWVTSLPRDAWVEIPDHGEHKINAAYSLGGPRLTVSTVEKLTGVHVDHVIVVDWTGVRRLADASGGIAVDLLPPRDTTTASVAVEMNGELALPYLSERKSLRDGDLDRIRRQHHFLRSFIRQSLDRGLLTEPARIRELAAALGEAVRVDERLGTGEMLALAASLRGLRDEDVHFLTAPVRGYGTAGEASVVWLDDDRGRELWNAMSNDAMAAFAARHPALATAERVR